MGYDILTNLHSLGTLLVYNECAAALFATVEKRQGAKLGMLIVSISSLEQAVTSRSLRGT